MEVSLSSEGVQEFIGKKLSRVKGEHIYECQDGLGPQQHRGEQNRHEQSAEGNHRSKWQPLTQQAQKLPLSLFHRRGKSTGQGKSQGFQGTLAWRNIL